MRRLLLTSISTAGLLCAATLASAAPARAPVPLLVSTEWLAAHHADPDVVVLHATRGGGDRRLLPGARTVPHDALMRMTEHHDLASPADLEAAFEAAGVSDDSHVVVYGEAMGAGWVFFALEYLGHARVSLLDGNAAKWDAEGRPFMTHAGTPRRGTLTPRLQPLRRATADDVQHRTATTSLFDARSASEHRSGVIPGARLLTWREVYADPERQVFKDTAALQDLFRSAGAPPGSRAITYCQVGLRASVLYFAARLAGLDARNYVGSWSDWRERDLPVERL